MLWPLPLSLSCFCHELAALNLSTVAPPSLALLSTTAFVVRAVPPILLLVVCA